MLAALWGAGMQWFKRTQRKDIWDDALDGPFGDIEAAKLIREICSSAADSAEKVGTATDRTHTKIKRDVERYERAARAAMLGPGEPAATSRAPAKMASEARVMSSSVKTTSDETQIFRHGKRNFRPACFAETPFRPERGRHWPREACSLCLGGA